MLCSVVPFTPSAQQTLYNHSNLNMMQSQALLFAAFSHEQFDLFQQLATAATARVDIGGDLHGAEGKELSGVVAVLNAVRGLELQPPIDSIPGLARAIAAQCDVLSSSAPDLISSASVLLWRSAKEIVQGAVGSADESAAIAEEVGFLF